MSQDKPQDENATNYKPINENDIFRNVHEFNYSPETLWSAFTNAEILEKWWVPIGTTLSIETLDFKIGGEMIYKVKPLVGLPFYGKFEYIDIKDGEYIKYIVSFCDEYGVTIRNPFAPMWPLNVYTEQKFRSENNKLLVETISFPIDARLEERSIFRASDMMRQSVYNSTYLQLEKYLAKNN